MMLTPLGRALIAHRASCPRCARKHYCGRYVVIARDMTVLSVREGTAT